MYSYEYPRPAITVDNVILAKEKEEWYILLIQRKNEPFKDFWALPGGFVDADELIEKAALRELMEETGIAGINLEFLNYFDEPNRDPRERTISMAFTGIIETRIKARADSDARKAEWFKIENLPYLAFDHSKIIEYAISKFAK